jgi:hypothetical protein
MLEDNDYVHTTGLVGDAGLVGVIKGLATLPREIYEGNRLFAASMPRYL